jgi:hypothetical protein
MTRPLPVVRAELLHTINELYDLAMKQELLMAELDRAINALPNFRMKVVGDQIVPILTATTTMSYEQTQTNG